MLNEKQIKTFQNRGFLLVEQVLDPIEILDPIISEYTICLLYTSPSPRDA